MRMSRPAWSGNLHKNFHPSLWLELEAVTKRCCAGQAGAAEWMVPGWEQYYLLRRAYKSLRRLEGRLSPGHPAREMSARIRNLLLTLRGKLTRIRHKTKGAYAQVEPELRALRTGLLHLEEQTGQLEAAMENADEGELPPDYARLRQLADAVSSDPSQGEALRAKALSLVEALKENEATTRDLALDDPDTPVQEMLAHLQGASKGLLEMAAWSKHRNLNRLEQGWDQVVDHLASFEELLEDFDGG